MYGVSTLPATGAGLTLAAATSSTMILFILLAAWTLFAAGKTITRLIPKIEY